MKKSIVTLSIIMMASGAVLMSCNSPAEKVENSKENVVEKQKELEKAKAEYAEDYAKFKEESENQITANDQQIEELKVYSKDKNKTAKVEYDKQIAVLEERNENMKNRLKEHKKAEQHEKWESFKREFKHDMNELKESLQDLGKNNVK